MAQKAATKPQFCIVTDWETEGLTTALKTDKDEEDNNANGHDILAVLPHESCVKIFAYLDVKGLCRSLQVSSKWRALIEGCVSLWRQQYKFYISLVPCLPCKRRNSAGFWKSELKKLYVVQRWLTGEFSSPKSYESLPASHIQNFPTELWGVILEKEMSRKKAHSVLTHRVAQ